MTVNIKSISVAATISSPDGFLPPFTTEGLKYAGFFDKANLHDNFAPGGTPAVVIGTPRRESDGGVRFVTGSRIDTRISTGGSVTLIAVADRSTITGIAAQYLISSYTGAGKLGKSLSIDYVSASGSFSNLYMRAHYKGSSGGTAFDNVVSRNVGLSSTPLAPACYFGRDYGSKIDCGDLTSGFRNTTTPESTVVSVSSDLTYCVGSTLNAGGVSHIYSALVWDRALSDDEMSAVYAYLKSYWGRRGVMI